MMPVCPGEVLQAGAAWPDPADQQLAGGGPRHLPDQRGRDRGHLPGGRLGAAQGRGGRQQTVIMSSDAIFQLFKQQLNLRLISLWARTKTVSYINVNIV